MVASSRWEAVFGNPLNGFGRPLTDWRLVYGAKTIDLCNGADPVSALAVMMSAHTVSTSNPACQIRPLNSLETAYRSLNESDGAGSL